MTEKTWHCECPRCHKTYETTSTHEPKINCGDCLMNDTEIIELTCTPAEQD